MYKYGVWVELIGNTKKGHWLCFIINNVEQTISLIDSYPTLNLGPRIWRKVQHFVRNLAPDKRYLKCELESFPQQDETSCGPRVLYNLKRFFLQKELTKNTTDIQIRRNIARDIVQGHISPLT